MFDLLSLFFLFVIFIVSLPALIYSFSYLKGEYSAKQIFLAQVLLCVFILSMALVVTVTNLIAFLVSWEIMSLVSYLLVVSDGRNEKSVKAGMIYIVMTHIGTAFIIAAFLIMYKYANSFDFIVIKSISSTGVVLTVYSLRSVIRSLMF